MSWPWPASPLGLSWKLSTRAARAHFDATILAAFLCRSLGNIHIITIQQGNGLCTHIHTYMHTCVPTFQFYYNYCMQSTSNDHNLCYMYIQTNRYNQDSRIYNITYRDTHTCITHNYEMTVKAGWFMPVASLVLMHDIVVEIRIRNWSVFHEDGTFYRLLNCWLIEMHGKFGWSN